MDVALNQGINNRINYTDPHRSSNIRTFALAITSVALAILLGCFIVKDNFALKSSGFSLNQTSPNVDGRLIAFAAISGGGKGTLSRALSELCNSRLFLEPEEREWPAFIRTKQPYGDFASFNYFRSIRVNNLWQAWSLRNEGKLTLVDSYYEKITSFYIDKPGMEWLISPQDPFYDITKKITQLDSDLLPNADCVVHIKVAFAEWNKMLDARNRTRDNIPGFRESYPQYDEYVSLSMKRLQDKYKIKIIPYQHEFGNVTAKAIQLRDTLIENGCIPHKFCYKNEEQPT